MCKRPEHKICHTYIELYYAFLCNAIQEINGFSFKNSRVAVIELNSKSSSAAIEAYKRRLDLFGMYHKPSKVVFS